MWKMGMALLSTRLTNLTTEIRYYDNGGQGTEGKERPGSSFLTCQTIVVRAAPEMDPSFLLLAALAALPDGSPDPTGGLPNRLSFSVPGGFFSRPPGALMECDGRCVILASALGQLTADVAPCLHFDSCDRYLRANGNGRK